MPLITTKTSTAISKEKEEILKAKFGKAIELINKSESWLMIDFQENCHLWFKGDEAPSAMIEVDLFGKATESGYDALTKAITDIVSDELGISPDRIYVKYNEINHWGYSGFNF
ncbi:MAG: tautomerase family protein [Clostridia bacterium]|nr:tautomerase family protein [Clostridia bacterium]